MYQYILFDLDGTLTDSKEGIFNCIRYALDTLGVPVPPEQTLLDGSPTHSPPLFSNSLLTTQLVYANL